MIKSLWQRLGTGADTPADPEAALEAERLSDLAHYFPIGKRLHYVPEFLQNVRLQTMVIGYRCNDRYAYENSAFKRDQDGRLRAVVAGGKELPVRAIEKLQILLPDTSDLERRLDYFTRAELGRGGQFVNGNTITLIAETEERGVPTVDTMVDRIQILKNGPFAEVSTVLVSPDLDTLALADKRKRQRVKAGLEASLHLGAGIEIPCMLEDLSEVALRISNGGGAPLPPIEAGQTAQIEFNCGGTMNYRIRGPVLQCDDTHCIIQLEYLAREGFFDRVRPLDMVELKAALLNRS